jgi:BlaI family penicillinase repressor
MAIVYTAAIVGVGKEGGGMKRQKPSDLELQVLSVLWERGSATVRDLLEAVPDGKKRAYTTMLSVVQVMEKKRLVTHDRDGLTHVYRPTVKKKDVLPPLLRSLTHNIFGGSPARVLQSLLDSTEVSEEELAEIRRLVRETGRQSEADKGEGAR